MLDHVSISVSDIAQAERFYDAVMAALDVMKVGSSETWIGYGERCDATHPDRAYLSIRLGPCRASMRSFSNWPTVGPHFRTFRAHWGRFRSDPMVFGRCTFRTRMVTGS